MCVADGTVHNSNHKGVMKIKATDIETGESRTIPMVDSYLAPGLRITLWAVPALCRAGHTIRFGFSTVTIILNDGMDNQTILHLRHPYLTDKGTYPGTPFVGATAVENAEGLDDEESMDSEGSYLSDFSYPQYSEDQQDDESYENILDEESLPDLMEPPEQSDSESESEEEMSVISYQDDESIPESLPDLLQPCDFSQGDISSDDESSCDQEYFRARAMKIDKLQRGKFKFKTTSIPETI